MAAVGVSAADVGNILTFVAPGFFAWSTYLTAFGQGSRPQHHALVISVALSLPLVAVGSGLADVVGMRKGPTEPAYVLFLIALGILSGYGAGRLRHTSRYRRLLRRLGVAFDPDVSVSARTLARLPPGTLVTVAFKDGKALSGVPTFGTADPAASSRELFLRHCAWYDSEGEHWRDRRDVGGVLINLDEVRSIDVPADPR